MLAERLDRLPSAAPGRASRVLWALTCIFLVAGIGCWAGGLASDSFVPGVIAMWMFAAAAATLAFVLPLPLAVASPLFMGIAGWLVDMLPFVLLVGWLAVTVRYLLGLVRERRLPLGGRWVWIPIALVFWTTLGAFIVLPGQRKHFVLLFGLQVLASATVLVVGEFFDRLEDRARMVNALLLFLVVCTVAVLLQWTGVPVEDLQDYRVSAPVERAYGIDAFVNSTGMVKYERAAEGGAGELRKKLDRYRESHPEVPPFVAFRAPFKAFDTALVVRFDGSARAVEDDLYRDLRIDLIYDNVGLAPGNEIPRMRSFPRNALTYAGLCVLLIPFGFYVAWTQQGRRRWLGRLAVASCLFGAGFSLARGAWVALLVGVIYLMVDGAISARRKRAVLAAYLAGAIFLTGFFLVKYGENPLTARAGAQGSIGTRKSLYEDTFAKVTGVHILIGFGSEQPRDDEGRVPAGLKYIPEAGSHSTYLNYLFRTGVPGALLLISLYVCSWLYARRGSRLAPIKDARTFSTLAAMAIVVLAAHGIVLSLYVEPAYTLAASIALGLGFAGVANLTGSLIPWKTRPAP